MIAVLVDLEQKFWLGEVQFYRAHLADEFLMLFLGLGLMRRAEAIEGIAGGRRWTEVEIRDEHIRNISVWRCR